MSYSSSGTAFGPFGQSGGIPPAEGGIDDGKSLFLTGISEADSSAGYGWYPQIRPGRYLVNDEYDFRYQYSRPQSVVFGVVPGLQVKQVVLPTAMFSPESFAEAPVKLTDTGNRKYTPVHNTVRWAVPVPLGNSAPASGFIDNSYLLDSQGNPLPTGPSLTDTLWWMPTFGAEVICVHRSRNIRSYDVLSDSDALLYEVATPDQLIDDRTYCHDAP